MNFEDIFSQYILPLLLGTIMFGIGITLTIGDFKRLKDHPKEILTALLGQMIILPLTAFLIVWLFDFPRWAQLGLILVAVCPAGASPNFITYYLKGRLALAVSTTAISSLLVLVSIPILVNLALELFRSGNQEISLPIGSTISQIFITILLPIVLGVLLKKYKGKIAEQLEKIMKWAMPLILLLIFGGSFYMESGGNVDLMKYLNQYPYAIGLNIGAMLFSYLLALLMLKDKQAHYTISTVVGIQNNALAIFIATTLLNKPELSVMAIIYSSFTFISSALFGYGTKKLGELVKGKPLGS